MGMRIHGGGGGHAPGAQDAQWQQRRQNFDALAQAISGGNLSSANDALAKIQGQIPSGGNINPGSFLGQIGAALQSGDMASAQKILAARNNRDGHQTDPVGAPAPVDAASAAAATNLASSTGVTSAGHGHRHHHHGGGGGGSPAMDLSQAIQSGDTTKAKSSMQTMLDDLQQVAAMSTLATSGTAAANTNPMVSSAAAAATALLQNPDFKALEDAIANGDATSMKTAWSKLISGSATTASTTATVTPPAA